MNKKHSQSFLKIGLPNRKNKGENENQKMKLWGSSNKIANVSFYIFQTLI